MVKGIKKWEAKQRAADGKLISYVAKNLYTRTLHAVGEILLGIQQTTVEKSWHYVQISPSEMFFSPPN